ncbi:hypothetical protein NA56DRAFT_709109 [Hyaloscypha hepaticicola]|uniref:C2H2-type domain-containing protein n=1 Tax=Hyaloscypha hepaticicola TaxID=2082293 RepID=A0A2J6PQ51_9HELO|nr:hypothetical protein NA56DRAFT_709109 [Hyaloscypha hepaticicola]
MRRGKNEPGYFDAGHGGWIAERVPSDCEVYFYNGTEGVEVFVFSPLCDQPLSALLYPCRLCALAIQYEEKQYGSMVSVETSDGNEAPTISARCKECIEKYHLLCDELEECTTDQAANVGFDKVLALATMEDARSRFKAWATNIAALQKPSMKSSLDSRLSEATQIRRRILSILADLKESLSKSFEIVSGKVPNEKWRLGAVSDSEEEELMAGGSDDDTVETCDLEQLLEAIQASNTSLMKLSMVIRNSPARDDYLKAVSRYSSYPADWDIKHLSRDYNAASHEKDEERTNALTKATTFVENKAIDDRDDSDVAGSFGSQTSYEPTVMGEQAQLATKLTVPPPPKMTAEGAPFKFGEVFTCPYCWTPQVVKNKLAWKKHVFHDLKPYVCTFKPCSLRMFRSRNEWFAHELQNRRREWRCHLCSELYNSDSSLSNHLSSRHPSAAVGAQLQALILKGEEPVDRISTSACMLCDEWETNLTNPNQDARRAFLNQGQSVKPYGTLGQFRRHLGQHMEQLALFALPMNATDQEEEERSDANQSDDTPDLAQVQNWRQGSMESSASGSDKACIDEDSIQGEPPTINNTRIYNDYEDDDYLALAPRRDRSTSRHRPSSFVSSRDQEMNMS